MENVCIVRAAGVFRFPVIVALCVIAVGTSGRPAGATAPEAVQTHSGCHEIVMSKGKSITHRNVRLTVDPVPATGGAYEVEVLHLEEGERSLSQWWPVDEQAFFLSMGDGYQGWSATFRLSGTRFEGSAIWGDDTGKTTRGWHVSAARTRCDAVEAHGGAGQESPL